MELILLERIARLGKMGDTVKVKNGYARNYLLPQGKALRNSKSNREIFEAQRDELETRNLEQKNKMESVHAKLDGNRYVIIRSAGETGQLYGSVSSRDIAETLHEAGLKVNHNQIDLSLPIKVIGLHVVAISLHPEIETTISINVARSEDEAVLQEAGQDMTKHDNAVQQSQEDEIDISELFEDTDNYESADAQLKEKLKSGDDDNINQK